MILQLHHVSFLSGDVGGLQFENYQLQDAHMILYNRVI